MYKIDHRDPLALAISTALGILGTFKVWTLLGLTSDDVAQLFGYLLALAAAHRTWQALRDPKRPSASLGTDEQSEERASFAIERQAQADLARSKDNT